MKRILILILVMVLTLGAITSCNFGKKPDAGNNGGNGGNETPAAETDIQEAVDELLRKYKKAILNGFFKSEARKERDRMGDFV